MASGADPLAIFYPPLKQIASCFWLFFQARKGNIYFTELAERAEYANYAVSIPGAEQLHKLLSVGPQGSMFRKSCSKSDDEA